MRLHHFLYIPHLLASQSTQTDSSGKHGYKPFRTPGPRTCLGTCRRLLCSYSKSSACGRVCARTRSCKKKQSCFALLWDCYRPSLGPGGVSEAQPPLGRVTQGLAHARKHPYPSASFVYLCQRNASSISTLQATATAAAAIAAALPAS